MRIVEEWGQSVGVSVFDAKTVCMLLKGSLSRNGNPCVRMSGKGIRYERSVKYLGVYVSERMNFKVHLVKMKEKIACVVGMMRRVLRKDWGLKRGAMKLWYKCLFIYDHSAVRQ